ncbi:DNA-directed RNA polymerases I and III subunit RPAC1 [Ischnura elegans]|uniref:DNA-directed RNA polymerases I and III subunit RPAC1 n=1 Tax=Ischnura elegans TaxID=197161 RepID=UPI001ED89AC8|nr:DNA-directed RNA polymerases I and III subunit RPAC1 [Ischnura elegans]
MDAIHEARKRISVGEHSLANVSALNYPNGCVGYDDTFDIDKFKKNFRIEIRRIDGMEMEFDLIGMEAAIPNAFRRILLVELPSMAIEKVFVYNNTSIIQDEVLAHRLGLIPLKADPRRFEYRQEGDENGTEQDTLEFELKVNCTTNKSAPKDSCDPDEIYVNHKVYSGSFKWLPIGNQSDVYSASDVGPVHDDILINSMRPGHKLDIKVHAVKGIGRDHAKFSPVATAFYRLLPEITLTREVEGDHAYKLQSCFTPGVIKVVDTDDGRRVAKVEDARYDMCSRNVFRHKELADAVKMDRVRDHFIFSIESVGAIPPEVLFKEAVNVLKKKCTYFLEEIENF